MDINFKKINKIIIKILIFSAYTVFFVCCFNLIVFMYGAAVTSWLLAATIRPETTESVLSILYYQKYIIPMFIISGLIILIRKKYIKKK